MTDNRSTHWSLTINNPTPADEEAMNNARQKGWTVEGQLEQGKDGTPHYQIYLYTRTQVRFSAVKKIFARAHIEPARNPVALKSYVHKEDTAVGALPKADNKFATATQLFKWFGAEYNVERNLSQNHAITDSNALKIFDTTCNMYIRKGYYIEQIAVNPQIRAAIKRFHASIADREQLAAETEETISVPEYITNEAAMEDSSSETQGG